MVNNKIINKILFGLEKFKFSDNRITVMETNLSRAAFQNLADKEKSKLSDTAQDLFNFLNQFAIFYNATNNI